MALMSAGSIERTVRKLERERDAAKATGLDEDARAITSKIRRLKSKYKEFSKAAGLREKPERMKASYIDEESMQKATRLKEQRDAEAPIRDECFRSILLYVARILAVLCLKAPIARMLLHLERRCKLKRPRSAPNKSGRQRSLDYLLQVS